MNVLDDRDYVASMIRLNDDPRNISLLLKIQAYVDSLTSVIVAQDELIETLKNAHETRRISILVQDVIEALQDKHEQNNLSNYEIL